MKELADLRVKIFADGADQATMIELSRRPYVRGFTTNPTLMRQAGVSNYAGFAREVLTSITDRPISFEVLADDLEEMERQALEIASWGRNVYVKIPISTTRGESTCQLVRKLSLQGVQVNVTAIMTVWQVEAVAESIAGGAPSFVSVFAGRIADTGRDPLPTMRSSLEVLERCSNAELIWASPRELLNIFQADEIGCHVIATTSDLLKKLNLVGKDLDQYSLDTVQMFFDDAATAGLSL
jgi:transaldolase